MFYKRTFTRGKSRKFFFDQNNLPTPTKGTQKSSPLYEREYVYFFYVISFKGSHLKDNKMDHINSDISV